MLLLLTLPVATAVPIAEARADGGGAHEVSGPPPSHDPASPVPEPSPFALVGALVAALAALQLRRLR